MENSLKEGLGTSFQVSFFGDFFDKNHSFVMLHKLTNFNYEILLKHLMTRNLKNSKILKFEYLKNEKSF